MLKKYFCSHPWTNNIQSSTGFAYTCTGIVCEIVFRMHVIGSMAFPKKYLPWKINFVFHRVAFERVAFQMVKRRVNRKFAFLVYAARIRISVVSTLGWFRQIK